MTDRRWAAGIAMVVLLAALATTLFVYRVTVGDMCIGCGGMALAPGTAPEEVARMERQMVNAVTALVVASVVLAVMVMVGRLAWRIEREG